MISMSLLNEINVTFDKIVLYTTEKLYNLYSEDSILSCFGIFARDTGGFNSENLLFKMFKMLQQRDMCNRLKRNKVF